MELDGWARNFQPENATTEERSLISEGSGPSVDNIPSYPPLPAAETSESYSDYCEADDKDELLLSMRRLCIRPNSRRYYGKSSGLSLIRAAMTIKPKPPGGEFMGLEPEVHVQRRHEFWCLQPVSFH